MPILGTLLASHSAPARQCSLPPLLYPLSAALLLTQAMPARAENCRLALVLALDVSGSLSAADDRLQRGELAAALLAPEVARAFQESGPVALYVFEWASASSQASLLPGWQMIESDEDLLRVAAVLAQDRRTGLRSTGFVADGTAVGSALLHAAAALAAGPDCPERTVDVSGDGVSDQGIEPQIVIDAFYESITVNALVIEEPIQDPMLDRRYGGDTQLVGWFNHAVVHGPGAFYVVASGFDDYERAMTAELLRELELPMVSGWPSGDGAG